MDTNQEFKKRLKHVVSHKSLRTKVRGFYVVTLDIQNTTIAEKLEIEFWWPRWYRRLADSYRRKGLNNSRITFFYRVEGDDYFRTYELVDGKLLQFTGQVDSRADSLWTIYRNKISGVVDFLEEGVSKSTASEWLDNVTKVEENLFLQSVSQPEDVKVDLFDYLDSLQLSPP